MKTSNQKVWMVIVLLWSSLSALAYDFEAPAGNNGMQKLQYTILSSVEQTVAVVGGTTGIIPCYVTYNNRTYTVTEIGRYAFSDVNITNVRLPLTLKKIRENAFGWCKASVIAIPDGVDYIGANAFWYSDIETIIVGSSVKTIGSGAFYGCSKLKTLVLKPQSAPSHVSSNYSIGNSTTTIIVPQLKNYTGSEIAKVVSGSMIEPIYFKSDSYIYSGESPQLEYIKKLSSATLPSDMTLKSKDAGQYEQSFFIGLSSVIPSYSFSDFDGYANYPTRGMDVLYTYEITPKILNINIDNAQRVYGDSNPAKFTYSVNGFVVGEAENVLDNPIIPQTSATITSDVGMYPITFSGTARNYNLFVTDGILTITKAPLIVQVENSERVYGEDNPSFSVQYINLRNNDTPELLMPLKYETANTLSDVGSYPIICSEGTMKNYEFTEYRSGILTINKAPLTLAVTNAERAYYENNPQFTYTLKGLRNNDDATCITTQPSYECHAELSSDCGEYTIVPFNANAKNYNISYTSGILKVTSASLTLKAKNFSREYGEINPILSFEAEGLKGNETEETALQEPPTIAATANLSSNVGDYPITISGGKSKNYKLSYSSGLLSITKAPISVRIDNAERIYGDANPTFLCTYYGFKLDDTEHTAFSILPHVECSADKTSNVGEYPITVSGGSSRNYEITTYDNAVLTVNPAPATIIATDKNRLYFEENPEFDFTVDGLRNNDGKACVSILPQYNCEASITSNAGNYTITPFGAEARNYVFKYQLGKLTINKHDLTASVSNYSKIYGTENPNFEIAYEGFVNNEDPSVLNQKVSIECAANTTSDVGTYPILLSGGQATNYNVSSYKNGELTINKADQTILWNQDLSSVEVPTQVALEAISTANLPVSYEMSPNNVATLYSNGGTWYLDCYGSGAVNIRATQNGDKNYNAASIVTKTLVVYGNEGDDPTNPQIYLNVDEPGTLSTMIAENRKYQIKNLRLTGNLNGTDINFIREMAGSDSDGNTTHGVLETLDISGCTIVSGGHSYYRSNTTSSNEVGDYMFYNCKVLTTLRLPENSISIGNSAFAECNRLSIISIPNSVKSFGSKSFANAISLLRIPMPNDLITIGNMAFIGCNGLTELDLPKNVSSLGDEFVNDCQNLSQINVEDGNAYFASKDGVLYNSGFDELLIFPMNYASNEYSVIDGVTSIAPYAFHNAKNLTRVRLPSTLASIGKDAFTGCVNLATLQVEALTPPLCQNDCFDSISKTRCELQVPIGCWSSYWVAPVWSEFNKIIETDFSGIDDVYSNNVRVDVNNGNVIIRGCYDDIKVMLYQINGTLLFIENPTDGVVRFNHVTSGIYIVTIDNKSYKIIVK